MAPAARGPAVAGGGRGMTPPGSTREDTKAREEKMEGYERYDLIVIGSGPAREKGAAQAACFGKRVGLVEKEREVGGAGINTGTVPSKTLRETALYFSGLQQRGLYGVDYTVKADLTVGDFMYRQREVSQSLRDLVH